MLAEWLTLPKQGPEISDAIVSFDPETLERKPVYKEDVIKGFASAGNKTAAGIIRKIPDNGGVLDENEVDRILIASHCEMQRISEEFQHGRRAAELLKPILQALRKGGLERKIRIVDIGCGMGYVVRWLAAKGGLDNVELTGVDFNSTLIREASRLAEAENLNCTFLVANAFRLKEPADIYLSTGILHHFRGEGLSELFRNQNKPSTSAFIHFDFYGTAIAPLGSWLFHAARMREPLAKHDGVLSAMRAYKSRELLDAAKDAAPEFSTSILGISLWGTPIPRVFHSLVGIRPQYKEDFFEALGKWRLFSLGAIE